MSNAWFWGMAVALALAVAAWLIRSMAQDRAPALPSAEADLQIYRDQLAETDRDLTRGTLSPADAARVKTEVARRLLEADRAARAAPAPISVAGRPWVPMALVAAIIAAGVAVYARIGQPDMPDLPIAQRIAEADAAMAARPDQATALQRLGTAPDPARIADLRADLAAQSDPQTLRTSYRAQLGSGDTLAALVTIERLLALPDAATAADHADQALALMIQAQGYISPEAEVSLRQALSMDMSNEMARYLVGEMFVQGQRYDQAFRFWRPLAENGNPQAPWTGLIRDQINDIAWLAGESYQLPDAQPGPSAADMAGAADMSDADRQEMIEGMVQQRQDRLAAEGGSAEDWVMLINALGVLGRTDEAQTAYDSAKAAHAADAAAMATLTAAATAAGLTP